MLVPRQLRGASEGGRPRGEIKHRRGEAVHPEAGIDLDCPEHADRLPSIQPAGNRDAIAADVEEGTTSGFEAVADVVGVDVVIREVGVHRAKVAEIAAAEHLMRRDPPGMEPVHECFHHLELRVPTSLGGEQPGPFGIEGERLLAEDMLPRLEGAHGPWDMERVGEGDVDGIDLGILEQLLIATMMHRAAGLGRHLLGPRPAARGHGGQQPRGRFPDGRNHPSHGD